MKIDFPSACAGIAAAFVGAADRLIAAGLEVLGEPGAPVVLTGGDARLLACLLDRPARLEPMLALEGLRLLDDRSEA